MVVDTYHGCIFVVVDTYMGLHLNRDCERGEGGGGGEMEAYKQQFTYTDLRGFHLQ